MYNDVISDKRRDLFLSHRLPGDLYDLEITFEKSYIFTLKCVYHRYFDVCVKCRY